MLIQRLYAYLQFTSELEQLAVYPASQLISRRRLGIDLPEDMIADAYKICTDEAWHAQFSYDLLRRVAQDTEITPWLPDAPHFLRRLERLRRELDPQLRALADVLFAVVSETLISTILNDIPKDPPIYTAVRDLVRDHAEDEGRHRAYFGALLRYVWPALSRRQQSLVGPLIPQFIRAFLEPDYSATAYALASSGFNSAEIEQIIAESYPANRVAADVRAFQRQRPLLRERGRVAGSSNTRQFPATRPDSRYVRNGRSVRRRAVVKKDKLHMQTPISATIRYATPADAIPVRRFVFDILSEYGCRPTQMAPMRTS